MKIRDKKLAYKGFYELYKVDIIDETNNKTIGREQFKTYNSVAALVWNTSTQKIILVKQFRVGAEKEIIEIPAGKRDNETESTSETITREIEEEIGYQTDKLKEIACFYTTPGPVTEKMTLFYAEVSQKIGKGGGVADENEQIEIIEIDSITFLKTKFEDAKTILGQQWFQIHQKK